VTSKCFRTTAALLCIGLAPVILSDCSSSAPTAVSSSVVPRQLCPSPRQCAQLARNNGFDSPGPLQAPSAGAIEYRHGWNVPPAGAHPHWVFVFEYTDRGANMEVTEAAFAEPHPNLPCRAAPGVEPAVSPEGHKVCFISSPQTGGSYVTYPQPNFAYQINAVAGGTMTSEAQKDALLWVVDQLRPV
jgi:hypothetical protein